MDPKILDLIGDFTWGWSDQFFIETDQGNFIWSDPQYGGDNSLKSFDGYIEDWYKIHGIDYGRSKGQHRIGDYICLISG